MLKNQDMKPVIVREPVMRPNRCALNPHIFQDPEGFIDTGIRLQGFEPRVYVAMASFRDLAQSLGWVSPEEREAVKAEFAELEDHIASLEARLEERERQLDAVAVLKQAGYTAARKPGRPPKVAA